MFRRQREQATAVTNHQDIVHLKTQIFRCRSAFTNVHLNSRNIVNSSTIAKNLLTLFQTACLTDERNDLYKITTWSKMLLLFF